MYFICDVCVFFETLVLEGYPVAEMIHHYEYALNCIFLSTADFVTCWMLML